MTSELCAPPDAAFTVHHDLFEKAGILHRDISIGNLMVEAADPSRGVLIDFHFATLVGEDGNPLDGQTFTHPGALPFRAYELLTPHEPVKAYYRHDLESFLYVLICIQTNYTHGMVVDDPPDYPNFHFYHTWKATKAQKGEFLVGHMDVEDMPGFPLREQWASPLRSLFGRAILRDTFALQKECRELDQRTSGGALTFESFMDLLAI